MTLGAPPGAGPQAASLTATDDGGAISIVWFLVAGFVAVPILILMALLATVLTRR